MRYKGNEMKSQKEERPPALTPPLAWEGTSRYQWLPGSPLPLYRTSPWRAAQRLARIGICPLSIQLLSPPLSRAFSVGLQWRKRCFYCIYRSQPETEKSCTAGDGDILYSRRRRCLVWPETEMTCTAWDGDVSYGRRWLLTLVWVDGIQPYWYIHIYTDLVALLDRLQSSFSSITSWTGYEPSACYNLYSRILYLYLTIKSLKNPYPLTTILVHQLQHHHHQSLYIITFLISSTPNMSNKIFTSGHCYVPKLTEETCPICKHTIRWVLIAKISYNIVTRV